MKKGKQATKAKLARKFKKEVTQEELKLQTHTERVKQWILTQNVSLLKWLWPVLIATYIVMLWPGEFLYTVPFLLPFVGMLMYSWSDFLRSGSPQTDLINYKKKDALPTFKDYLSLLLLSIIGCLKGAIGFLVPAVGAWYVVQSNLTVTILSQVILQLLHWLAVIYFVVILVRHSFVYLIFFDEDKLSVKDILKRRKALLKGQKRVFKEVLSELLSAMFIAGMTILVATFLAGYTPVVMAVVTLGIIIPTFAAMVLILTGQVAAAYETLLDKKEKA